MSRNVYNRVCQGIMDKNELFREVMDCVGNLSSTTDQKAAAALRQLKIGTSADSLCEILSMLEFLIHKCRRRFVAAVCSRFEEIYLR